MAKLSYEKFRPGPELFIVAYVNEETGEIEGFPQGGGSSTEQKYRVFDEYSSALRSSRYFPGSTVVSTKGYRPVAGKKGDKK